MTTFCLKLDCSGNPRHHVSPSRVTGKQTFFVERLKLIWIRKMEINSLHRVPLALDKILFTKKIRIFFAYSNIVILIWIKSNKMV